MKLLIENWRKFLEEDQIVEASDEEIEYLDDMMEMPIEKLPFANIFGDRYRIIENFKTLDPESPLKSTMDALAKMGWSVAHPSDIKYDEKNS